MYRHIHVSHIAILARGDWKSTGQRRKMMLYQNKMRIQWEFRWTGDQRGDFFLNYLCSCRLAKLGPENFHLKSDLNDQQSIKMFVDLSHRT